MSDISLDLIDLPVPTISPDHHHQVPTISPDHHHQTLSSGFTMQWKVCGEDEFCEGLISWREERQNVVITCHGSFFCCKTGERDPPRQWPVEEGAGDRKDVIKLE